MRILFINPGLAKSLVYNTSPVTVTEGYLTLRCTKHQFELQRAVDYCVRDGVDRKLQCSFDSDQMLHLHVFRSADDDPETAILLIKPKNENLHFCYSLMKGRWHLSNRELELIVCFVEHPDLRHVSTELNISYETTRWHFKRILSKFDAKNQAELLARVFSYCLVPD